MKISVLTNAFNEPEFIRGCVDQFAPRFQHLVLCSIVPWHGSELDDSGNTARIARSCGSHVKVVEGVWPSAQDQLNYGLKMLKDSDWVVICDADERYTQEGVEQLESFLESLPDSIKALRTNQWHVYWKTPEWELTPTQTDYPLIAIRPSERFGHIRSYGGLTGWCRVPMYHFSYVRTDPQMAKKISSFEAATEFDGVSWYDNVWKAWDDNHALENLHPVNPPQFEKAVYNPAPDEVWRTV